MTGHEMDEEAMPPHSEKARREQFNFKHFTEMRILSKYEGQKTIH